MNRRVNDRQLEVLQWIADGCPAGKWPEGNFSHKTSASALKARGLVTIKGHARTWSAAVTEAGKHYIEHGVFPLEAVPRHLVNFPVRDRAGEPPNLNLGEGASETLRLAKALIEQLQESGKITVADPTESTRAHYRRVLHACRAHHLVPAGHDLRSTGRSSGDIVVILGTGSPAETSDWDRIRTTTRKITTNIEALRAALETTSILKQISKDLRPRAIEILLDLAADLLAHEVRLGANVKLKTPKLFIQAGSRRPTLTLTELLDEVPHIPTAAEQRELRRTPWKQVPKSDRVPSGRLHLQVERDGSHMTKPDRSGYSQYKRNGDEWFDEKRKTLERQIPEIASAIKKGTVDDDDAREREKQRRVEAHEAHEREQAAQRRAWEDLRNCAREKAIVELREATFVRMFEAWQGAQELRAFAARLEAATSQGLLESRPKLREWLEWARSRADVMDPVTNLEHLDDDVFKAEPSADDLRPHMEGWDPSAPHKDYSASFSKPEQRLTHVPQPRPWHPGMQGRPSWWRH
ncbi:hypothetical protein [Mycolicibacterium neoaurum]|uniref:Uncharacterized protein n=1 Tax=Mycolicibacterium neoaurum TaxID=1795 RepID=A0AAV2WPA5_MYCNE|nr:hypothetical protein [Mycolicibacterium neoaurum]TLH57907.1 hypothetical protein C1S81_15535 [Mycolicibacterium neoaurum]CDQ45692.1 hypothetical protein BN1047_03592 [Mycolicibacterium neoaurum]